jgi:hypothetical protein
MKMVVEEKHGDSLEPVKVPHSLHSFKRDEKDKEVSKEMKNRCPELTVLECWVANERSWI